MPLLLNAQPFCRLGGKSSISKVLNILSFRCIKAGTESYEYTRFETAQRDNILLKSVSCIFAAHPPSVCTDERVAIISRVGARGRMLHKALNIQQSILHLAPSSLYGHVTAKSSDVIYGYSCH